METLFNGFRLEIYPGEFPLSTDSMLLSDFVRLPRSARVLDLGSGCGALGILLCAKDPHCQITGLELSHNAHAAAIENICRNSLDDRMTSICTDLRQSHQILPRGGFDVCVSNPPYFSSGAVSKTLPLARNQQFCTTTELFEAAHFALKFGGDFFLVHRPEQLGELCAAAEHYRFALKRLTLVRHRAADPVNLILVAFRKGGKQGTKWDELCLYLADGSPSADYRRVYHL